MGKGKIQLRTTGKGFVLLATGGFPLMRRLVDTYTAPDKKIYIKVDDKLHPLRPSHKFISG